MDRAETLLAELRRHGIEPVVVQAGPATGWIVPSLPGITPEPGGEFLLTGGEAQALVEAHRPEAAILESGTVVLAGQSWPFYRLSASGSLRPAERRIPEGAKNLERRTGWFQKRSGGR